MTGPARFNAWSALAIVIGVSVAIYLALYKFIVYLILEFRP
jgi:hypothetical protein